MTRPAVSEPKTARIGCKTVQPIPAAGKPDLRVQSRETRGPRARPPAAYDTRIGCRNPLLSPRNADRPIPWPNSSFGALNRLPARRT
jgi:hypothetical protein